MRKIIGIGETILDILFRNGQPQAAVAGGSVFNGFVSLGRLGLPLAFISELGNDKVGGMIRAFMEENHIPTDYVDCFPDGKSPISLAFMDDEGNAAYQFYKDYPSQRLEMPFPRIEADDILIYGSYYALNPALRERTVELLDYAKERKAILYYDPNFRDAHLPEVLKIRPAFLENLEYADIVRGSEEDFFNLFQSRDAEAIYKNEIQFYCPRLLITKGAGGVELFTEHRHEHFDARAIKPVSTIGAGDNFNAGLLYGLLKYEVTGEELPVLPLETWEKIVNCGIDLATEACRSEGNYISKDFAAAYRSK
ncbi:MAG: carbohydrate kinase [Tannerella sp.]|jgi:fructokinase|nr:carbohydrate kinase [Tannerella sp.]